MSGWMWSAKRLDQSGKSLIVCSSIDGITKNIGENLKVA
jgi:hypothetical protein